MSKRARRTWPQRLTLVTVVVAAFACFATAGALATGQWVLSQRQLVTLAEPTSSFQVDGAAEVVVPGATTDVPPTSVGREVESDGDVDVESEATTTTSTILLAEPDAANFLVTGADNGDCAGGNDPSVGEREELGERSDTIMVWRANPDTNQLAVLSLPRDLYVDIAGGRKARINSAYQQDDPSRLIDTIFLNFGVPIDHYVQVDFCAFRRLVEAVGGVTVPFEYPTRDTRSGLVVPEAGCVELDGDMALSYVRSRHYEQEIPAGSGNWEQDGTSDFGRIARQQDFLRRTVKQVIDDGLYSPSVASALIETNREYLVTDTGLTLRTMLEFANTLRNLDPDTITTYRVEASGQSINGQSVLLPDIDGDNMQAILSVFRGEAMLGDAPVQEFDDENTTTTGTSTTIVAASDDERDGTATTLPSVDADENVVGVAPSRDDTCN